MANWLLLHKIAFVILLPITKVNSVSDNRNMPCHYLDSINITAGDINNVDDSISFDGISYPKNLYAEYDYELVNESYSHEVAPHKRGCTCKVNATKSCVRMCCPRGEYFAGTCFPIDSVSSLDVNVYADNGELFAKGNVFDLFNYVVGKPCASVFPRDPTEKMETDTWKLYKNGTVSMGDPPIELLDKNKYCLNPWNTNGTFELTMVTCFFPPLEDNSNSWLLYGMFFSVPFLVATIVVYTILPELRNIHGKSLVCYLFVLIVGNTTLGWIKLNGTNPVEPELCRSLGYTVYFSFVAAFFWLNVISYDLWHNFCGTATHYRNKSADVKKFIFYSIYAWGSTTIMVALCFLLDSIQRIPTKFKPAIGTETCFLPTSRWSQFLYFYQPIIFIMICNCTFFILTSLKIRKVKKELARNTDENEIHRKNLHNETAKCSLFLRLFIVMGVSWSMEAISWLVDPAAWFFYATDLMNTIQGVIIFFLFVIKPTTKELIIKRWKIWQGESPRSGTTKKNATLKTTIANIEPIDMVVTSTITNDTECR